MVLSLPHILSAFPGIRQSKQTCNLELEYGLHLLIVRTPSFNSRKSRILLTSPSFDLRVMWKVRHDLSHGFLSSQTEEIPSPEPMAAVQVLNPDAVGSLLAKTLSFVSALVTNFWVNRKIHSISCCVDKFRFGFKLGFYFFWT